MEKMSERTSNLPSFKSFGSVEAGSQGLEKPKVTIIITPGLVLW